MTSYMVYRYSVELTSEKLAGKRTSIVTLPANAKVLSVGVAEWRPNEISIWCLVDPDEQQTKTMEVLVVGTGFARLPESLVHRLRMLGTAICNSNQEVYHVFEVTKRFPRLVEGSGVAA